MIMILNIFLSEQCHKYVLIEFLIICFVKQVHIAYFGRDTRLVFKGLPAAFSLQAKTRHVYLISHLSKSMLIL